MNIYLQAILRFTRGTSFWPIAICESWTFQIFQGEARRPDNSLLHFHFVISQIDSPHRWIRPWPVMASGSVLKQIVFLLISGKAEELRNWTWVTESIRKDWSTYQWFNSMSYHQAIGWYSILRWTCYLLFQDSDARFMYAKSDAEADLMLSNGNSCVIAWWRASLLGYTGCVMISKGWREACCWPYTPGSTTIDGAFLLYTNSNLPLGYLVIRVVYLKPILPEVIAFPSPFLLASWGLRHFSHIRPWIHGLSKKQKQMDGLL